MATATKIHKTAKSTINHTCTSQVEPTGVERNRGTPDSFADIVEEYQRPVFNLCYRMLNDVSEAEDATQEAFVRAYVHFDSYDATRKLSTWLFSIASHYCLDRMKKRRLPQIFWDEVPGDHMPSGKAADQPEYVMVASETSVEIQALLGNLAPEDRSVVILKYWHGMRCQEIAEVLNASVSAIKSRLFRARKKMAAQIDAETGHQFGQRTNDRASMYGCYKPMLARSSGQVGVSQIAYLATG